MTRCEGLNERIGDEGGAEVGRSDGDACERVSMPLTVSLSSTAMSVKVLSRLAPSSEAIRATISLASAPPSAARLLLQTSAMASFTEMVRGSDRRFCRPAANASNSGAVKQDARSEADSTKVSTSATVAEVRPSVGRMLVGCESAAWISNARSSLAESGTEAAKRLRCSLSMMLASSSLTGSAMVSRLMTSGTTASPRRRMLEAKGRWANAPPSRSAGQARRSASTRVRERRRASRTSVHGPWVVFELTSARNGGSDLVF